MSKDSNKDSEWWLLLAIWAMLVMILLQLGSINSNLERISPAIAEYDCKHMGYTGWRIRFWGDPLPSLNSARIYNNAGTVSMGNTNSTLKQSCGVA